MNRNELVRKRLVRLVFIIYGLLLFEGALRKWGAPQFEHALFFVRLPFVMWLYWVALVNRQWPRLNAPLLGIYVFAVIGVLLIPVQMIVEGYELRYLLLGGYGWLGYFFYVPLAFIIADQFRAEDLRRLVIFTFWVAIVSAPLVVLQFHSAFDSVVNMGSGSDGESQFHAMRSALGRVRPSGLFSSSYGQQLFVASVFALVVATWIKSVFEAPINSMLLVAATLAVLVMIAFSQSRGLFIHLGIIVLVTVVGGIVSGSGRAIIRIWVWLGVLIASLVLLWPMFFPDSFEAFATRWVTAQAGESREFEGGVFGRALHDFYSFVYYLDETPALGYLIGMGGNAAFRLSWVQLPDAAYAWSGYGQWAEQSWPSHIVELGIPVGIGFIFYRIGLVYWVFKRVLRSARQNMTPVPFALFGFVGILLLTQLITGHVAVNGHGWMFLGVTLAYCYVGRGSRDGRKVRSVRQGERGRV